MPGMTRRCPICGAKLTSIETDWTLREHTTDDGHEVATIGTAENAREDLKSAAKFQIAANLAAYDLDFDAQISLGSLGTIWIQCPQKREKVGPICLAR